MYIYIYLYISISLYYILMRHEARTPPPPDLVFCGLLQLTLFGKLQNVTQSFEVSARYYKCFANLLPVLCGYFALGLVLDGLAEFVPTAMKTEGKRVPTSITSHST